MIILKNFRAYNNYQLFLERQSLLQEAKSSSQNDERDKLMAEAKDDVERCIAKIMGKYKFFGEFAYKFRYLYTYRIPTMATDGKNIFVNPRFCSKLNDKQIMFVLCHEFLHNVMIHFERKEKAGMKNNDKFNRAADLEINPMLVEEGLITASELTGELKGLYEEKYLGWVCEDIYNDLKDNTPQSNPPQAPKYAPAEIGSYVKTKDGKYGVIDGINADGSYDVKELSKEEVAKVFGN